VNGEVSLLDHSSEETDEREGVGGGEIGLEDGGDGLEANIGVLQNRIEEDREWSQRKTRENEGNRNEGLTVSHDFRESFPTMTAMMLSRKLK